MLKKGMCTVSGLIARWGLLVLLCFTLSCSTATQFEERKFYHIDKNCLSSIDSAQRLDSQIQLAFQQGFECLRKLESPGRTKTWEEIHKVMHFWDYVEISCPSEIPDGFLAKARFQDYHSRGQPQIWLSVKNVKKELARDHFIAGTVFHELLHLPGYDHLTTIDYAYACEFHCFPPDEIDLKEHEKEGVKNAKEICSGKYSDPDDIEYLRAINNLLLIFEYHFKTTLRRNHAVIIRHPKSNKLKLLSAMYVLNSGAWPVAYEFANSLKTRYTNQLLTPKEKEWFEEIQKFQSKHKVPSEFKDASMALATGYLRFYEGDILGASDCLNRVKLSASPKKLEKKKFNYMKKDFEIMTDLLKETIENDAKALQAGLKH